MIPSSPECETGELIDWSRGRERCGDKLEVSNYYLNSYYFHTLCTEMSMQNKSNHTVSSPFSDCHQDFLRWGLKVVMTFSIRWLMVLYTGSYGRLESQSKHFFSSCSRTRKGQGHVGKGERGGSMRNPDQTETGRPPRCVQTHTHTDLQMTDNAVGLFSPHPTCGRGLQVLLSSNQQVPRCWVTAAMGTAVAVVRLLANSSSQAWREGGDRKWVTMNRKQQCRVPSFPNRASIQKLVLANKFDLESVVFYLSSKKRQHQKLLSLPVDGRLQDWKWNYRKRKSYICGFVLSLST